MSETFEPTAIAERVLMDERATALMRQGVRVRDPRTLYVRGSLICGERVTLDADVIIEGEVRLGDGVIVGAHTILRDCDVGNGTEIQPYSLVEGARTGCGCRVGPYARLRPGTVLGDRVSIGNFCEIKNSVIGHDGRINHHAFVGDATLADQVTLGAGTITCNHDGVGTNPTIIERGVYVGSGCQLVAPIRIGAGATIAAGSTLVTDVPAGGLTIARAGQVTIPHWTGPKGRSRG